MKSLETVYFEHNPIQVCIKDIFYFDAYLLLILFVQDQAPADYRRKLKLTLPSLTQIDATLCR